MWVRNQDRTMLIECATFKIVYENLEGMKCYLITNDIMQGYPLASYSSEEKAMDVMDLLQLNIQGVGEHNCFTKFVFEFPQDIEVKVEE